MYGYRKFLLSLIIIGIAAVVPLNQYQAEVLISVAGFMLGANAAISVGRSFADALKQRKEDSAGNGASFVRSAGNSGKDIQGE